MVGDTGIEPVTPTVSMLSSTSWLVPLTLEPLVSGTSGVGWRGWRWSVSVAAWPPRGPGDCRRSRACPPPRDHTLLGTPAERLVPGCTLPTVRSPPPDDVMRHWCDPDADVDPSIRPMKAPGCASATHGLPSCRKDTDPRPESAHVPDEARLPALATRRYTGDRVKRGVLAGVIVDHGVGSPKSCSPSLRPSRKTKRWRSAASSSRS